MLYIEYEDLKNKYREIQRKYDEILNEKEALFRRTQPQAVRFDKERVSGGKQSNVFEDYLIQKDKKRIDERLAEARSLLDDRAKLLILKETELRQSNDPEDKVYRYRYIDRMRIRKISRLVNYSEAQIFRILKTIQDSLKHERK